MYVIIYVSVNSVVRLQLLADTVLVSFPSVPGDTLRKSHPLSNLIRVLLQVCFYLPLMLIYPPPLVIILLLKDAHCVASKCNKCP